MALAKNMPTLSAYTNTENTALVTIQEKGYQIWYDAAPELFNAEKEGWDFMASSATELLGAIAIFEHQNPSKYSEYWWRRSDPLLLHNLPDKPEPFESVLPNKPW